MTDEQIKKIAEEYVKWVSDNPENQSYLHRVTDAKAVLTFLSERYCVVERSKVVEMYECYTQIIQASRKLGLTHAEDIAKGSCATMRDIFGSETFNKKEE